MQVVVAAARELEAGRPVALAFVTDAGGSTPRAPGAHLAVFADGSQVGTIGGGEIEHRVVALAQRCLRDRTCATFDASTLELGMCCGGRMRVHIEPVFPALPFVVYGAGHVARAVVPMLTSLDFEVTVVDDRDELNTGERFPGVQRVVGDARQHAALLGSDRNRHVLVVTHDHALDEDLCRTLLPLQNAWVGMIGSRAKVARFRTRLAASGLSVDVLDRLCAPVGLDLGAETPAEIAVSIVAELTWRRRGGSRSLLASR